ncbi:hypothetical protein A3D05_05445 [Candidatus Gottesmanbacteria bacterium RIFCSPHIGHO2_02_FULL_40_24]|uniref:(d)CMP kinase n=1 Tax=Candidatus Gottesmanbacteria bacterium RIFCSPHIGHO2_01_FULL_40_15 TaxID=1798376 RepID=A0A1F5Z6Y7_9BACT|nr:MAG: hypothetical protein A2777_02080 [Candidatus Gottesmanbacteria bacterium RIFCSPHIGHO2_01_FULL_40_15]OGG16475.1 MAG: hypothetical protein A3D05_05445 [Candidatus Gottesmanbacteria bacterium RIFCSPHIGHO2_02_FULL_40_24]OGG22755.1 MAG: hypothetical protein A3B48_03075 [Candidatus Gottesmanbacteria bacterium RIFCSPLOWO2_01_FULL_40_10]OGG25588.1 MAG: hypothetical protein A3E42_04595 [Candidatus Gottesmanbacteria bacterium RIFCSPHIGHO2_12_FULL_40_13]OGG32593.1 MAG: hypothetical protein A3I80_0
MDKKPAGIAYRCITVSGRVASGATTLSHGLKRVLNWRLWNGGEIYRQYAREKQIPLERTDLSSDDYHIKLDNYIREKLKTEKQLIMESWLSGYDARNIEGIFRIFVDCSDFSLRVDRLVNREKMTIDQAKEHLKRREEENLKKWERLYKINNFWDAKYYDLVIDTFYYGPTESLNIALKNLGLMK